MTTATAARSYAGQTAEERDAERRRRLHAAGLELFGTRGYAATTIERLCSSARVSTRHFYLLYASKEEAFVDLYDHILSRSYANVDTALAETLGQPLAERVAGAVLAYVGPMLEDTRVARIAFVEVMGVSSRLERLRLDYRESLVALVEAEVREPVAAGEIRDRDFRFAALALAGATTAVVYDWVLHPGSRSRVELERDLMQLAAQLLT